MQFFLDEDFDAAEFTVGLNQHEFFHAADIGLHDAVEDELGALLTDMKHSPNVAWLLTTLARRGLLRALEEARERRFQSRYPDDFAEIDLSNVIAFPPRG